MGYKSQENAVFIAIHPTTYRGGGFLAHGVLKKNTIKYYDRLCGFERTQFLSGYGWMQGYFNIGQVMETLKTEGTVRVPFAWLYDIRQYDRAMDGCYMEITKM